MQLNYKIYTQDKTYPWVVLLHGLFGDLDNLANLAKHLQNEYNVICFDLPDHGQSPHTEQFSFANCAEHIFNNIQHHNISHFYILGHSLGGKIAALIALQHPQQCLGLLIADIAPVSYPSKHNNVLIAMQAVIDANPASRHAAQTIMSQWLAEPGVIGFLLKNLLLHKQAATWRCNFAILKRDYDKLRSFPTLSLQYSGPVLFIKGSESDYLQASQQTDILRLFPAASFKIMHGVGHWLHVEKPQVFNHLVARALLSFTRQAKS